MPPLLTYASAKLIIHTEYASHIALNIFVKHITLLKSRLWDLRHIKYAASLTLPLAHSAWPPRRARRALKALLMSFKIWICARLGLQELELPATIYLSRSQPWMAAKQSESKVLKSKEIAAQFNLADEACYLWRRNLSLRCFICSIVCLVHTIIHSVQMKRRMASNFAGHCWWA